MEGLTVGVTSPLIGEMGTYHCAQYTCLLVSDAKLVRSLTFPRFNREVIDLTEEQESSSPSSSTHWLGKTFILLIYSILFSTPLHPPVYTV